MGWSSEQITYDDSQRPDLTTVIQKVQSRLNGLKVEGASSAKVALTDCEAGKTYAILVFNETIKLENMNATQLPTAWKVWQSSKDDINEVYSDLVDLIRAETLTDLQWFFSDLSLTACHSLTTDNERRVLYTLVLMYRGDR